MRKTTKLMTRTMLALAMAAALATPAHAGFNFFCSFTNLCDYTPPRTAPEIDPGVISGAVTVLAGGVLMLARRRRRD